MKTQAELATLPEYTGTGTRLNGNDWAAVFANLTPHTLRIHGMGDNDAPSYFRTAIDPLTDTPIVARVRETTTDCYAFPSNGAGVFPDKAISAPILNLGGVEGLPPPSKFHHGAFGMEWIPVYFVVSRPCAMALLASGVRRPDVLVAGESIRDGDGIQYAAKGFYRLWPEE